MIPFESNDKNLMTCDTSSIDSLLSLAFSLPATRPFAAGGAGAAAAAAAGAGAGSGAGTGTAAAAVAAVGGVVMDDSAITPRLMS
jgi:hypothetical protein